MVQKRALIVDDSKAARLALKKMLERYDLQIEFAESGEAAIEFLKHQSVDVIFMDHSMPGMDGFEAVSVIKSDPRTAIIPVMMYTAKEGEVYVGQARALGAVGVLPKEVQPGVLFEMLLKLGLVEDRRAAVRRRAADEPPAPEVAAAQDEMDLALERQALGISIQALITRTLQDQHLELRADILASNKDFARRVAEEIHARQQAEALPAVEEVRPKQRMGWGVVATLLAFALLPLGVMFVLFSQAVQQRDAALQDTSRLRGELAQQASTLDAMQSELQSSLGAERDEADSRYRALVAALEWAVNEGNQFDVDELPFDDARLQRLTELLSRLAGIGFAGTVRLDAHLGTFCLEADRAGGYVLADPAAPITDCDLLGNPFVDSASLSNGQSAAFANFLAGAPLFANPGIEVEVVARGRRDSVTRYPYPPNITTAGEWNQVAALNNRVEFTLLTAR